MLSIAKAPRRGDPPSFGLSRISAPSDDTANPTTLRQRQLHNLKNQCIEIKARLSREDASQRQQIEQIQNLWNKAQPKLKQLITTINLAEYDTTQEIPDYSYINKILDTIKDQLNKEAIAKNIKNSKDRKAQKNGTSSIITRRKPTTGSRTTTRRLPPP